MKTSFLILVLFSSVFFASTETFASSSNLAGKILLPGENELAEVGEFKPEVCSENKSEASLIKKFCFGRAEVQERSVRSLLFIGSTGMNALYIELDPAPIEMLKPVFDIVGPVLKAGAEGHPAEIGQASVWIDRKGEIVEVKASTPRLGHAQMSR